MKKYLIVLCVLFSLNVYAGCTGTGNYYNCYDLQSGNNYSVQKYGNTTNVTGYNANTGSTWNQNSNTIGNTTYTYGNSNGRSWNEVQTPYSTYGTNANGNSYYYPR